MAVSTLFDNGLDRFLEEDGNRPGDLWLFLHIPKTAGSTFGSEMSKRLKPNANIHVDYLNKSTPYSKQLDDAIEDFLRADQLVPFRFASGHINSTQALRIASRRKKTKIITILRNPVDRVISDYRYQLTEEHPLHKEFSEKFPTIDSYIGDEQSQNKMFKRLAPKRPATNAEVTEFMEQNFSFVGLVEGLNKSTNIIGRLIGEKIRLEQHVRKTTDTKANLVVVNDELRNRIAEANRRDMGIYNHFRRRLANVKLPIKLSPRPHGSRAISELNAAT